MFPSNKNINNNMSDEKLFLFRIKKIESDVVNDLFLAIQNIVAGTAVVSNTVVSDTRFQYKIHLSNDAPLITLHYEMKLNEKDLLVPVVECKAAGENNRVDDDNNANKRSESFEITLTDRKQNSFPLCHVKQEIPEMLSVLNDIENIDDKKLASFDDQTKVNHSVINSTSDSISNSDASERKLFTLLAGNSRVITPVKEEGNRNSERVVQNKRFKQIENNDMNKYEERGPVIEKKYNCSYCDQLFKSISAKKMHERIHTGEKLFKFQECGKAFTKQNFLTDHKKTHTSEKPFTCEECGRTFILKSTLILHKKIHMGEKPFTCEENGKAFTLLSNLTHHKKTYTGERLFKCEECDKSFSCKLDLMKHKKYHQYDRELINSLTNEKLVEMVYLANYKGITTGETTFLW